MGVMLNYLANSGFITIFVLLWLLAYFITTFTILISRCVGLSAWKRRENKALEAFLMGTKPSTVNSSIKKCITEPPTRQRLNICLSIAKKEATSGLTWLSIIASTSPFIGLFGTVIGILDTFSKLGATNAGIGVIAPAISEALVATGAGIFVAIPAYTFHLILKRKAYEIVSIIEREIDVVMLGEENV